ncbi:hypothetical protein B0H10DRAFT_2064110 [Mycena sp. CBHHK59/15]|nr:hypothetical protein B0H10DRAFT_2064110 [Mycena sp. CBHHK59/15]
MFDVGRQRSERKKWIHCFERLPIYAYAVGGQLRPIPRVSGRVTGALLSSGAASSPSAAGGCACVRRVVPSLWLGAGVCPYVRRLPSLLHPGALSMLRCTAGGHGWVTYAPAPCRR